VKVVSWNLAGAPHTYRGQRYRSALAYLREVLRPDVALLQEVRFDGGLTDELPGYEALHCARPEDRWGSAVLVRGYASHAITPRSKALDQMTSYLAYAEFDGGSLDDVRVVSVHAPPSRAPAELAASVELAFPVRTCGVWHSDVILSELTRELEGRRFIVGGDWNESPYLWDATYGVEDGAQFFAAASNLAWTDSLRHVNPEAGELQTLFRSGSKGYQIDHVFTDSSTATSLTRVCVDEQPGADGLSDHAPLIVEVDL
jgi:exonuclease III